MKLHTKALYNLIRLNAQEDPSYQVEPWTIEDLREVPLDVLFQRLKKEKISLEKEAFVSFASSFDTPEEFVEILLEEEVSPKTYDAMYLVVFELWRRLMPEKPSLSIFCDELDRRFALYDQNLLESDELVQDALANLKDILDQNVDAGSEPIETFEAVCSYCAHDIEGFLYDYISELLDAGNEIYASELIEGFSSFMPEPIWFELLRARVLSMSNPSKANAHIAAILDQSKKFDTEFLFEVIRFLSVSGDHRLFIAVIQTLLSQIESEEEFLELMEIAADYYRRLDLDQVESAIEMLLKKRKESSSQFHSQDPDVKKFAEALK